MKQLFFVMLLLIPGVAVGQHNGHGSAKDPKPVTLEAGLGNIDHPVSTKNPEAQKFFNQGLEYVYAFNHAEAVRSFKQAAQLDPQLAMAYWGVALSLGSNYNVPADSNALLEAYAAGLAAYRRGEWKAAISAFNAAIAADPDDMPSHNFVKRVEKLAAEKPKYWNGIWRITSK